MSEVVETVQEPVKELFVIEKDHLQIFLNYLAKRPYDEVFQIVETMKQARVLTPTAPSVPVNPMSNPTDLA